MAPGAGTKGVLFCGRGLGLVSSFIHAPRRPHSEVGKVFEEDYLGYKYKNVLFVL